MAGVAMCLLFVQNVDYDDEAMTILSENRVSIECIVCENRVNIK
jgi:hypothetical protein